MKSWSRQSRGVLVLATVVAGPSTMAIQGAAPEAMAAPAYPIAQDSDGECSVKVQDAHASSHKPGTTNVVATMTCKSSKPHISGTVVLEQASNAGGWQQVGVGHRGKDGVARLAGNAAWDRCINGIQMRGRALFSYTTDGKNTRSVEGLGRIATISRCP